MDITGNELTFIKTSIGFDCMKQFTLTLAPGDTFFRQGDAVSVCSMSVSDILKRPELYRTYFRSQYMNTLVVMDAKVSQTNPKKRGFVKVGFNELNGQLLVHRKVIDGYAIHERFRKALSVNRLRFPFWVKLTEVVA